MSGLLSINGISVRFGGVQAVDQASFTVQPGELLGFIGPNGAGKTTALRIITGIIRPNAGRIMLNNEEITGFPTHRRIRRGLALTHQIVRPLRSMTVLDNVVLAAGLRRTKNPLSSFFHVSRREEEALAREMLVRVGLAGFERTPSGALPLGQIKRLEVARALALRPKVMLLDEPLAGLNQQEAGTLADTIVELTRNGLTVVLVEHNLGEVLRVSSRLVVMDNGRIIADGPPDRVMADPQVQEAYLGKTETSHVAA